jgi:hypothetical protein
MTEYTVNTTLRITEKPHWIGTRQPTVLAKVATVKETSVGTLYALDYTSSKTANGKPVFVTKFLFEKELSKRVTEVVKRGRKPRQQKQTVKLDKAA